MLEKAAMTLTLSAFFTSLILTFVSIPSIIKIAELKHLYDDPDDRKSHSTKVPTLGGLAIFAGVIFSLTFWSNQSEILELQYIISSIIILFFIGMKDDIVPLVAFKKLLGQILASCIIIHWGGIRITSFYGLLGIYDIGLIPSYILSLLAIIGITNAFNLIDGINWLASGLSLCSGFFFGVWFLLSGHYQYSILSFSLCGSLIGFMYYNKTPARIFMGDTGSLIVGLVNAILAIKFIEFNRYGYSPVPLLSSPAIAISVLSLPIFDTVRVFTNRIMRKRSPFKADRTHIHHYMIQSGLGHVRSSLVLMGFTLLLSITTLKLRFIEAELLLIGNLSIYTAFILFMSSLSKKKKLGNVDMCATKKRI